MSYIIFEGPDGAGKTSIIKEYKKFIKQSGRECKEFKFPTEKRPKGLDSFSQALWHLNDFEKHVPNGKARWDIHLFDRSFVSTAAYSEHLTDQIVHSIISLGEYMFFTNPGPIYLVYVSAHTDTLVERIKSRKAEADDMDRMSDAKLFFRLNQVKKMYDRVLGYLAWNPYRDYEIINIETDDATPEECAEYLNKVITL